MGLSELIHSGFTKRESVEILAEAPTVDTSTLVAKATATAKGDLFAATAAGVIARLGVGTDGQVLTADAASAAGLKYAAPASNGPSFRGAWSGLTQVSVVDFAAGAPAGWTSRPGTTFAPAAGAGAPAGQAATSQFQGDSGTSVLSTVVPAGVTQLKFYAAQPWLEGNNFINLYFDIAGANKLALARAIVPWTQYGPYLVTQGDTLLWRVNSCNWSIRVDLGYIEYLKPSVPYVVGDAVTYAGSLYVCAVASNSSTPGVDANWTKLLIGTAP